MANATVKTAAQTSTDMSDTVLNPTITTGNRRIIHITLVVDGVTVTGASIYNALDTQYATVSSEKQNVTRGQYIFNIGP